MRHKLWIILGVALIVLAACGGQAAVPTDVPPAVEEAPPAKVEEEIAPSEAEEPAPEEEAAAPLEPTVEEEPPPAEEPVVESGPRAVTFTTDDGVTLGGTLFGPPAPVGVILSHMYPTDQTSWHPFAQVLADHRYLALAYDFRGYGVSEGERSVPDIPLDLTAALAFMREQGAERIILIGASMGGTASIKVAAQDGNIVGLVVISSPRAFQGLEVTDAELAALTMPSLWLGSRNDPATMDVEAMAAQAAGPDKTVWVYEGSSLHGTFIFDDANGEDLQERLLEFIVRVIEG